MTDSKPDSEAKKPADDKKTPETKAPTSKPAQAQDMSLQDGRKRVAQLKNTTALTLYDYFVSNGKTPKEAARMLLTQYGTTNKPESKKD